MQHRHLDDPGHTFAAIDDVIVRGSLEDWLDLGRAFDDDPQVRARVALLTARRQGDESTINHDFWRARGMWARARGPGHGQTPS